ncbi:helix-turn-helix domain-containing protein [Oscillibacter ruminantium]|uniref:helix-turn-helix domain-containing protein n=1 Tax=Oscillibacter ruminantium TaxID=1263547 RepID=UPI0002FC31D8|nr:helix-turn-helix transcriptional regulator [Oscillibacter ruminantium]
MKTNNPTNNIKRLREARGLNQSALADLLGIRPPSVWKLENGMQNPSYETLANMADIFGCSMDEVMGRKIASA